MGFIKPILFGLVLTGCGAESPLAGKNKGDDKAVAAVPSPAPTTAPVAPKPTSTYIADAGALPTCDAAAEGWLVYIKADEKFQACLSGAWTDVEVGKPTTPDLQFSCPTTTDLDDDPNTQTLGLMAEITKFSDGDFAITCMDRRVNTEFTFVDTTTDQEFFRSTSNAVTKGLIPCVSFYAKVTYNVATNMASWEGVNGAALSATVTCTALQ